MYKYLNCVNLSSFDRAINMLLYVVIQILGSNFPLFWGIIIFYNEFGTKYNLNHEVGKPKYRRLLSH